MLNHGYRRHIGVALLIVLAAAAVVTPATASSQLDGDDCEPQWDSHPLTAGIDALVDLARLPGQAAMVTQHLFEAFAKVIPQVLRSLL